MRARTVDFLTGYQGERVPVLTDRLVRTIQEQNPGYQAAQVVPLEDLRRSCRDNITRVLQLLVGGVAAAHQELQHAGDVVAAGTAEVFERERPAPPGTRGSAP